MSAVPVVESEPEVHGFCSERLSRIEPHFARYVDDGRLPGFSVLVSRHGQIVYLACRGRRDVENDLPMLPDTRVRIYSMTKPITSVAAMMLYEEGAFELTDPIARWLPEFANPRVHVGGTDLKPVTVPATEPIRVWHLLTHTAGLTYGFHRAHPVDAIYRARGYEWSVPDGLKLADIVADYASMPLLFHPGTEWNYSVATDVLGRLIEVISGIPLDRFLSERILAPLGMSDTSFRTSAAQRENTAALYTPRPGGGLTRVADLHDSAAATQWLSGGGGLVSTLHDYHRFLQFLRGHGRLDGVRLLGDRTVRYMTTNQLPGGVDLASFGRPLYAESPFDGVGFGLGFAVTIDPTATRTLGSVGEFNWGGAASTAFWVDPVEDLAVVFLSQLLPSSTYPLRSQLRQMVYQALD